MKTKLQLVLVNVAILLIVTGTASAGRWRIMGVPLDMPEEDGLDGQALEGIYEGDYGTNLPNNYGGYIAGHLKDSLLRELPFHHINSTMKDGRELELWFSTREDGRKIFGVQFHQTFEGGTQPKNPAAATKEAEAAFGQPDRVFNSRLAGMTVLVFVDGNLPKEKHDAMLAQLPRQVDPKEVEKFSRMDLRERIHVLGPDFRGTAVTLYISNGKVTGVDAELLDFDRARTVFNLEKQQR
jgi:hypothetical protein